MYQVLVAEASGNHRTVQWRSALVASIQLEFIPTSNLVLIRGPCPHALLIFTFTRLLYLCSSALTYAGLGSANMVVRVLWSTKYATPFELRTISQPGGSSPSSDRASGLVKVVVLVA